MKNILLTILFSVLIVVGPAACSKKRDVRSNPDLVINEEVLNDAIKQCKSGECILDKVVMPITEKYCSENKLTSAQCDDLAMKALSGITQHLNNRSDRMRNITDQLNQATEKIEYEQRQKERRAK
jgi:hypothetical protein